MKADATNDRTAAVVDTILRLTITGAALSAGIIMPNLLIALDKPLQKYWRRLDARARERETRRVITYMKSRNLVKGDYEHGLQITNKGRQRLEKNQIKQIAITRPAYWDKSWRLIFFDIPEERKLARNAFIRKLHSLDFYPLQRSVWVHPFPCREFIEKIAVYYEIDNYISYIETSYIDNQQSLKKRFKSLLTS